MRKLFIATLLAAAALPAFADSVNGHFRSDGTYVQPYNRSDRNGTVTDNYSHKGNANPYTGKIGTNYNRNNATSPYYGTQPKKPTDPFRN